MAGHNDPFFAFCKAKFKNRQTRSQVASGSGSGWGKAAEESSPRVQFARAKDSEQRRMQNRYCTPEACLPHQSPSLRQRTPNLSSTKQNWAQHTESASNP